MRGVLWDGNSFVPVDDLVVRPPGPGEVAVDIEIAGLCHSDLNPVDGRIAQPVPVVLGHEAVGVVADAGPGTTLRPGRKVVLSVLRSCGKCRACRAGRPTICRQGGTTATPFSRRGETVHQFVRTGAFAQRTVVAEQQAIPIDVDIPAPVAAMLGCATVTAFGAVEERARVRPGESVLITGAGGLGLNAVVAARAAGAERILVVDRNPRKEAIARALGATDFADDARAFTDVDVAIECVGHPGVLSAAVEALAWGGRCVIVGLPDADAEMALRVRALFHDKDLLGCRMGSVDPAVALPRLAARVASHEVVLDPLVSKVVPLPEIDGLVADLRAGLLDRGFLDLRSEGE